MDQQLPTDLTNIIMDYKYQLDHSIVMNQLLKYDFTNYYCIMERGDDNCLSIIRNREGTDISDRLVNGYMKVIIIFDYH